MTERSRLDYDAIADRFDEDRADWLRPVDEVIPLLLKTRLAVRAVDIGCGTGLYIAAQPENDRVAWVGVDPSAAMLSSAARTLPLTRLIRATAEALPLASKSVDYAFSSHSYHHFFDKSTAFAEVARVLVPSGVWRIVNSDPWSERAWWGYRFFEGTWRIDQRRYLPVEVLTRLLEAVGFTVETRNDATLPSITVDEALAIARRRVVSQFALLEDASYIRGLRALERLARDDPDALVEGPAGDLVVTAVRIAS